MSTVVSSSRIAHGGCFGFCMEKPKIFQLPRQSSKGPSPSDHPAVKEIDRMIAREMYQMSLEDRERALDAVHGTIKADDEDPNFVNACLLKMGNLLEEIKVGHAAYAEAERLSESHVRDPNFRILFLRAEQFDAPKAAERILKFFDLKKELFGAEKLVQKITLQDLNDDDLDCLNSGEGQISPIRDAAGRPIVTFAQRLRRFKSIENVQRAFYYLYMAAMEPREAQLKGIVCIFYNVDTPHVASVNSKLRNSLPINFASLHLCISEVNTMLAFHPAFWTLNTHNRVRYRLHYGTYVECIYELVSFGIPRNAIPVASDGRIHIDEHLDWVQRRMEMEQSSLATPLLTAMYGPSSNRSALAFAGRESPCSTTTSSDFELRPNDVLFGRTKGTVDHPGNSKFRRFIDLYLRKYEEAERFEKACIAEAIVQMVQDSGGRFLKREKDADWEEADGTTARKKVAHAFRNRRKGRNFGDN